MISRGGLLSLQSWLTVIQNLCLAGFMPIQPARGLQALQKVLNSSGHDKVLQGVGGFAWSTLLRQEARRSNPLFAEFLSQPAIDQAKPLEEVATAKPPAVEGPPKENIQREILQLLESVLGEVVDANQPLMEVTFPVLCSFALISTLESLGPQTHS